jgi:hypothetical protein
LFVIIKINTPRCLSSDKYLPSSTRNNILQDVEDGMDIEDQFNPMEEHDTNKIVEPNNETNRLIQDIFVPID